jgi:hypothetical protein
MERKNEKINLEFTNFLILYRHYKAYQLPIGVILACILVIFLIIIPQFQQYFISQQALKIEVDKLQILKSNYSFLTNLDDSKTGSDFKTLSYALPSGKDFAGVMNAIAYVSAKTGVSVGDFNFSLGDLSNSSTMGVTAFPSVQIDVNLVGNAQAITKFIEVLYKTAPVSEVTNIKTGGDSGTITIVFYYKPFPSQKIDGSVPIVALSGQEASLVKNISLWNNTADQSLTPVIPSVFSETPVATASASGVNTNPF